VSALPEPFTTASHDVSGLDGFMLNTDKLMASELVALATGDEFKSAVCLWCRAWKQIPAGSLPNDERVLAAFSGAGSRWPKVREVALRGFVLCSDGRLYHKTLCEDVHRAAQAKAQRQERTKAATEARNAKRNVQRDDERDVEQTSNVTKSHRQDRTGQEGLERKNLSVLSKEKRGTRIPDDFEPDQSCHDLAKELNLTTLDVQSALANFRDYWRGVPASKGVKLDWQATFRNQLRHVAKQKGSSGGPHIPPKKPASIAAGFAIIDAALEREEAAIREEEERQRAGEAHADELPGLRQVN
jgi:uncharacterized protein YdaU (DUF1376 family)